MLRVSHGAIAPSARLRSSFCTTSSGSKYIADPIPEQVVQAPCGLLNENIRGVISGYEMPHSTHAKRWLK